MAFDEQIYDRIREGCQSSAAAVVPVVYGLVLPQTIVDVGGGEGWWAREFAVGHDCQCLVLDESAPPAEGDKTVWWGDVQRHHFDLAADELPILSPPSGKFDLALCLEVGEHVPEEHADRLVALLATLAPVVLFSAAIPNQGGHGHVNEQWPAYWAAHFWNHDLVCSEVLRHEFWDDERVEPWYRQNMLLFAHYSWFDERSLAFTKHPQAVVHPEIYQWRVEERDRARAVMYPPEI